MPSLLTKKQFDYESMKVKELFFNDKLNLVTEGVISKEVRDVFGRDLMFGEVPKDRPYIFNSLVTSIDGRIAFEDDPKGPLIAKMNREDADGASLDYWILNILRGAADGILVGTNSIAKEFNAGGTGHCYDENIEIRREQLGLDPIPWRIAVTLDGRDVEFKANQFTNKDMSTFFYTTLGGVDYLKENSLKEVEVIGPFNSVEEVKIENFYYDKSKAYIIVAGTDGKFNHKIGMKILREIGVKRLLVESPTVTHYFMEEKILDELFLNYSCIYVGGNAMTIGASNKAFKSGKQPCTEIVSVHMHSPHFMYIRHKLKY